MLGLSALSLFDFVKYSSYLKKDSYFNSSNYKYELTVYYENLLPLITEFKDYEPKENTLASQNSDGINVQSQKNSYVLKSDLIYDNYKRYIDLKKCIKYYIKDKKSGAIYSNLDNTSNLKQYIKDALYVESFPKDSSSDKFSEVNRSFQDSNFEGQFIILKNVDMYSQLQKDHRYFNSIGRRITKEGILGISLLIISLIILRYLLKKRENVKLNIGKVRGLYEKTPLDIRVILFIANIFIANTYLNNVSFFYKPISINHIIKLTFISIYVFYILINLISAVNILKSTDNLVSQWNNSLFCQLSYIHDTDLKSKRILRKVFIVLLLTVIFSLALISLLYSISNNFKPLYLSLLSIAYIFIYVVTVPIYILKKAGAFSRIINGTNEIVSGNLDYQLDEEGGGALSMLAHNINNMKEGFRNSVDGQLKSERLKAELITNVSHDLKTPLTSIINYTALLKKGGISQEDTCKYIDILDHKSQRLKILIEDLFEVSKISSGAVELNIEKVDICSLLRQAIGEFDEKISSSALIFKINIPASSIHLNLDGKKTWRIFENLINNILKYSQPNSRVYIDLMEHDDKVAIVMKNMSSYEMDFDVDEIFERFKRGDKARSTEGSGLGLAIAKSLVELQGGKMRITIDGDLFKVCVEFG